MTEGQYIPVSQRFERDMDFIDTEKRSDSLQFSDNANTHFVYHDMTELVDTEAGKKVLAKMLGTFNSEQKHRLEILDGYSKGVNHTIFNGRKRMEKEKADHRVSHNWGGYISNYITGYLMSKPITIGTKAVDDNEDEVLSPILEINDSNDIDSLNFELGFDTSRYGRAFELHYRKEDGSDIVSIIDPKDIFVIRSSDVSKDIIGAVHVPIYNDLVYMTIYTANHVIKYEPTNQDSPTFVEQSRKVNLYQDVPVVEWWNNRFRQGDFETEIPLIDAYDSAQSDTANYMSDLNDALLVIKGDFESAGIDGNDLINMKNHNLLALESGTDVNGKQTTMDAGYIYKQYDVAGTEAYKTRLVNDIYKLSHVPNLEDDRFNANNSGIALQYKMIGLEQIKSIKESFYTKALRRRYEMIGNIRQVLSQTGITADDLTFTFHTNIPQDVWAEVEKYINANGEVSQVTLMELASFIDSSENEKQRLAEDNISPYATDEERQFVLRERDADEGTE